jgi:hypothetical protein
MTENKLVLHALAEVLDIGVLAKAAIASVALFDEVPAPLSLCGS